MSWRDKPTYPYEAENVPDGYVLRHIDKGRPIWTAYDEDEHTMTPKEHLEALRALCKKLEPELDEMIQWRDDAYISSPDDDAVTLACKLYDAILDPDEAT
jgi:hypothetical protein